MKVTNVQLVKSGLFAPAAGQGRTFNKTITDKDGLDMHTSSEGLICTHKVSGVTFLIPWHMVECAVVDLNVASNGNKNAKKAA